MKNNINATKKLLMVSTALTCLFASIGLRTNNNAVKAEQQYDSLNLGVFNRITGMFENATATNFNKYKGIIISLASDIALNEEMVLPEIDGYTIKTELETDYSKTIELTESKTAKEIAEEYIRKINFVNCAEQKLSVILTKEVTNYKAAYFAKNDHYYIYVPDAKKSWIDEYNAAMGMEFMGRKGYLATITSLEEDAFIRDVTNKAVGWLGGTILKKPATKTSDGLYYNFSGEYTVTETTNTTLTDYESEWYWACGPEIDTVFFDVQTRPSGDEYPQEMYERNVGKGHYFNWCDDRVGNPPSDYEPNGPGTYMESCLTTLQIGRGCLTQSYGYSWNNISYNNDGASPNASSGYVVEFGDQIIGDRNSAQSVDFVSSVASFHDHNNYSAWSVANSLPTSSGNYYLTSDVILSSSWIVPSGETRLCLDGHSINANNGNFSAIVINNGSTLYIEECKQTKKYFYYDNSEYIWKLVDTQSYSTGGVIAGANNSAGDGGAVRVNNGGTLYFYGGTILENKAKNGAGIYNDGQLYMYGGAVIKNEASNCGSGVFIAQNGSIIFGYDSFVFFNTNDNLYLSQNRIVDFGDAINVPWSDLYIGVSIENGAGKVTNPTDLYSDYYYYFESDNSDYALSISKPVGGLDECSIELSRIHTATITPADESQGSICLEYFYYDFFEGYENQLVTIYISGNEGYMIDESSITIEGNGTTVGFTEYYREESAESSYYCLVFLMPAFDVTISASFVPYQEKTETTISDVSIEGWKYGEMPNTPSANCSSGAVTFLYSDNEYGYFSSEIPTEVGDYYVMALFAGDNEHQKAYELAQFSISKNVSEITSFTMEDWVYGETPKTPSITKNFGEVTYLYSTEENGTYTSDIPTEVGTYFVKAVIQDTYNYTGTEKITSFRIVENTTPTPTPEDDSNNSCSLHWILVGAIVLAVIVTVLYIILKFKDTIAYIVLAILDVTSAVTGVFGLAANKCLFCGIMLGVNVVIISLMIVFTFLYSKKKKEDKDERKAR